MRRSICNQCKQLSESWTVLLVFLFMCYMVLSNFIYNVNLYEGREVALMYHPMRILSLTQDSSSGIIIMQMLPLLVVFACGFTYMKDRDAGIEVFEISRSGAKTYYVSKLIAVFLVTMAVFAIPLLGEIVLNCLAFPLEAKGDLSNVDNYNEYTIRLMREMFYFEIYQISPYLYAVVCSLVFGAWAGLAVAFVVALSYLPIVKSRLLLFLPLYMMIVALEVVRNILKMKTQTYYGFYLYMYEGFGLSRIGYISIFLFLIGVTVAITRWKCKEDCRNR